MAFLMWGQYRLCEKAARANVRGYEKLARHALKMKADNSSAGYAVAALRWREYVWMFAELSTHVERSHHGPHRPMPF